MLRYIDPTSGTFDAGFLQWVILGTVVYLWGVFMVWVGWQIAFKSLDRLIDKKGELDRIFKSLPPTQQYYIIQGTFIFMVVFWLLALKLVPL